MNCKTFTSPFIRGMSVAVPKERVNLRESKFDSKIIEKTIAATGIQEVRRAPSDKTIFDYCLSAAKNLLDEINFDKADIDGVVFVTYTGDYPSPGCGYLIQSELDLSNDCIIVDLNQACAGYVNGLFQAFMLVQSGYCKNVLLCTGDTMSKIISHKSKSEEMVFSDAGCASIISASDKPSDSMFAFYNDGKRFRSLCIPAGGSRQPIKPGLTDVETTDEDGNVRTPEDFYMNGLDVMTFVMYAAPKTVNELLKIADLTKDDIDMFLFHQANKTIVKTLERVLRLPKGKTPLSLQEYGNTISASIPLTLCLEQAKNNIAPNKVVMCAYGNGLACAAATLSLANTYFSALHEI